MARKLFTSLIELRENVLAVAAFQMLFGGWKAWAGGALDGEWPALSFNAPRVRHQGTCSRRVVAAFGLCILRLRHLP